MTSSYATSSFIRPNYFSLASIGSILSKLSYAITVLEYRTMSTSHENEHANDSRINPIYTGGGGIRPPCRIFVLFVIYRYVNEIGLASVTFLV